MRTTSEFCPFGMKYHRNAEELVENVNVASDPIAADRSAPPAGNGSTSARVIETIAELIYHRKHTWSVSRHVASLLPEMAIMIYPL